jgi:hypothetical protein
MKSCSSDAVVRARYLGQFPGAVELALQRVDVLVAPLAQYVRGGRWSISRSSAMVFRQSVVSAATSPEVVSHAMGVIFTL